MEATEHELLPIAARTREAVARANTALERVDQVEEEMIAQREDAALEVAALEAAYREDDDEHDEATEAALGLGLGAALLALIPFLWGRFRELSPVRRLADRGLGPDAGLGRRRSAHRFRSSPGLSSGSLGLCLCPRAAH